MRLPIFIAAAALALAAGCERGNDTAPPSADRSPATAPAAPASGGTASGGTPSGGATTTTTPAEVGPEAKKGTTNPVQQQVDPKESEQRRDFQQKGDAAGPTSPDSKAK